MEINAVIMAAGFSSRFHPLSQKVPKALTPVKGEVLIERQIAQLREAGIQEIYVVVGYKKEQFYYLREKWGVHLVENKEYETRNNHSSIYAARNYIRDTYICSSDNYFPENPFLDPPEGAYYAALYQKGATREWCITADDSGLITNVTVGGQDSWYMLGHTFWNGAFSRKFLSILEQEYDLPQIRDELWEDIYIRHIHELPMFLRKYSDGSILEFDTLAELAEFDPTYQQFL